MSGVWCGGVCPPTRQPAPNRNPPQVPTNPRSHPTPYQIPSYPIPDPTPPHTRSHPTSALPTSPYSTLLPRCRLGPPHAPCRWKPWSSRFGRPPMPLGSDLLPSGLPASCTNTPPSSRSCTLTSSPHLRKCYFFRTFGFDFTLKRRFGLAQLGRNRFRTSCTTPNRPFERQLFS